MFYHDISTASPARQLQAETAGYTIMGRHEKRSVPFKSNDDLKLLSPSLTSDLQPCVSRFEVALFLRSVPVKGPVALTRM